MDNYLILNFTDQPTAQAALATINGLFQAYWTAQGYTADSGGIIGQDAASGAPMPQATQTAGWDIVQTSPDNTFYFSSPSNDPRYATFVSQAGLSANEEQMPGAWAA